MSRYLYNMNGSMGADDPSARYDSPMKSEPPQNPIVDEIFSQELRQAITATREFFFNHQHPDGYWLAELEGDSQFQSETVLLLAFLGEENTELAKGCAKYLLDTQNDDGGWSLFADSESEVNNTVKAYFALKLTGQDPTSAAMNRARVRALELGGIGKVDGITRFFLALLGQIPYGDCPTLPSPSMLFSRWQPFDVHSFAAWVRPIVVPLTIVSTLAPVRMLTMEKGIRELFTSPENSKELRRVRLSRSLRIARTLHRFGPASLRKRGMEKAKQWILEHCRRSDGPGAAFAPIVWSLIALKSLGYQNDSEEIRYCREQLRNLAIFDNSADKGCESVRVQPSRSPVRDTTLTLKAMIDSGLTVEHPALRRGIQWVRSRRIAEKGDWSRTVDAEPSAWCFQFNNPFYPDCEDTAIALEILASRFDEARTAIPKVASRQKTDEPGQLPPDLRLVVGESAESLEEARQSALDIVDATSTLESGLRWLLAMQCKDGGWAAFDRNNDRSVSLDFDWQTDASGPDITGRVLMTLGRLGFRYGQNAEADRAVTFLKRQQQPDGSWIGRWGVNYVYGTWLALAGLAAVGVSPKDPMITAGAHWLSVHQHSSGGWGESPKSYDEPSLRGHGKPTASQTAWAVMGLIAAGKTDDPAVHRGVRFLLDRQRHDGTWHENAFTGVGAAPHGRSFLKYHFYSVYFPLMALSMFAARTKAVNSDVCEEPTIFRMEKIRLFSPESECYNNVRPGERPEEFTVHEPPKPEPPKSCPRRNPPTLRLFLG